MYLVLLIWIYMYMPISVTKSQNVNCESGWYPFNGRCYYFSEDFKSTRDGALSYCRSKGSYLVSVPDEKTNDFLYTKSRGMNDHYWIGIRPFDSNDWGWSNGNVDTNIPWVGGVPTDGTACARFRNGRYHGRACQESHNAVCERESNPNDTTNWRSYEKHWYYLLGYTTAMSGARTCISKGGYLVRPTTDNERTFVTGIFSNDLWTGLTRLVWDDGTGFNWNNYAGGKNVADHPDNASCVALDKNKLVWKDKGCTTSLRFICATAPVTTTSVPTTTPMMQTTEESSSLPPSPTTTTSTTSKRMSTTTTRTSSTSTSAPGTSTLSSTTELKPFSARLATEIDITSSVPVTQAAAPTVKSGPIGSTSTDLMTSPSNNNMTPSVVTQPLTFSNLISNYMLNVDEGSTESSITNDSAIVGTQLSSEYKALEIVLFVIYTLVVIMLVTDLVLLVVYLKWKKSSESKPYDASANTDDNDIDRYDDIPRLTTSDTTKDDIYVTDVESTYANSNAPIYAVPDKIKQHHSSQL